MTANICMAVGRAAAHVDIAPTMIAVPTSLYRPLPSERRRRKKLGGLEQLGDGEQCAARSRSL